ncbi:transcriptional repressor [Acinetobacter sp. VNK23]|uniref:Ferric uptake regulation protein n=1 Tax=Acinetobacter corruptisaponis TaxID=3045147 RepID=A0ABY8S3N6_9GAMM|nr:MULTISPECIES: transcriptional repressor [Acinetobacter]MDM1021521.1 transcriptional repressor [Acinetobacter thutiue]WHP06175.1 transcriptional repressor [Acinetobacter sp. KCTC 92772]
MFSERLLNTGLGATTARLAVLEVIANHGGLTADDIYMMVNKNREVKIGTIYRVLADLEKHQLIKRILFGRNKSIYKLLEQKINCNVMDMQNGKMQPYHNEEINQLLEQVLLKLEDDFSTIDLILYK